MILSANKSILYGQEFPYQNVKALTSNDTIDFTLSGSPSMLNEQQILFLNQELGEKIEDFYSIKQVHGNAVVHLKNNNFDKSMIEEADAVMTDVAGVAIGVRTADCLPMLMVDPKHHAVAAVHAGWKGTELNIACTTLEAMSGAFGSHPEDIKVVFGPCIRECCYKVGEEFLRIFSNDTTYKEGYPYFNLPGANLRQLQAAGVNLKNVSDGGICTCCQKGFYSYRRNKEKAGRMLHLILLRK